MISSNASESGAGEKAQTEDDKRGFSLLNSFLINLLIILPCYLANDNRYKGSHLVRLRTKQMLLKRYNSRCFSVHCN